MQQSTQVARVSKAMIDYFAGDARRINHFLKVYGFAKTIGTLEGLTPSTMFILEIAALTHDIGIKVSEAKFHSASGHYQQIEGPGEAKALLDALQLPQAVVARVCWLIARHHTYTDIQELDYQILVEADFLVNIDEDAMTLDAVLSIASKIFRTKTGLALLHSLYMDR